MPRKSVDIDLYPAFIGPFSQGTIAGDFIFTSGQVPFDRGSGTILSGNIKDQTRKVMNNVQEILHAAGATIEDLVKVTLFIRDYRDYSAINQAYGEFFSKSYPARSLVQVANLPDGVNIIADAIAYIGERID